MKKNIRLKNLALSFMLIIGFRQISAQCSFTGLNANYCTNSASSPLTPGISGGTFSGPGVTGSSFNPSVAGPGTHTINYNICSATYSITSPTFSPIVTATVGTSEILGDDALTGAIPIGFNFKFFCNTYTNYYISSNGYITFNAGAGNGCCQGLFMPTNSTTPDNLIAYAWTDLYPPAGGSITHTLIGTAPNRIQVVSFNGINHYNGSSLNACCPITAQILLYETTNVIEIHTTSKPAYTGSTTYSITMGIQSAGGGTAFAVSGRNGVVNWTATNDCKRFTPGATCNVTQTTVVSPSTITVVGNNSICIGSTASLTATGNTTYTWSTASNTNSITVSPSSNTTYSVSGTNSFGCVANSAITVTVDNTPTVTANSSNGTSGICPGRTVTLNGAGATSYSWLGGTPTVTNGVPFTIGSASGFTVTGANACGTATAAITLSIHPSPNVTAIASTPTLCSGNSLTLTATGNATNYVWSGGAAPGSNGAGFIPPSTAVYTVIGTNALTCTVLATVPVTVYPTPINPPTANPALICIGGSSTLSATGASNYTWTSSTQTVNTSDFIVSPGVGATTYTVTKGNSTCFNTQMVTVITNPLPSISAIVTPTVVCALTSATFAVAGAQTYTWTAPGPPTYTFSGSGPVVSPIASGDYTVVASDGTCIATTTVFLAANPNPTISILASSSSTCSGAPMTFTASGGLTYTWTTSGGQTLTSQTQNATHSPTIATAYHVIGNNSFGCTAGTSTVVLVNNSPTIIATANKPLICSGDPITLAASGAASYTWGANAGSALTATALVNPTNSVSGLVTYTVGGTSTNSCIGSGTVLVNVFVPTLSISGNTNTCEGGSVTLTGSGIIGTSAYDWNIGTSNVSGATLTTTLTTPSIFTLSANSPSAGITCPATQTVALDIYFNPTITATPQRTAICRYESVDIAADGGVSYLWNNGSTSTVITVSPIGTTANYTVSGTDVNGCTSIGTVQLKISGCVGIAELNNANNGLSIYPNPNEGKFTIESNTDIQLNLVNELGQLVRVVTLSESNNYAVNVSDLAKGIYFISGQKDSLQIYQKIVVTK